MTKRTALVTGASRGIGAAIAARLHVSGWNLSLGMRKPKHPVFDESGACHLFPYDAETGGEDTWVVEAKRRFGRIDAVIACAGIMIPRTILSADDEEIDRQMAVNVKAPRRLVRAAWSDLKQARHGRVIILASLSGQRVKSAASGAYSVSKFAAVALSHAIRQEGWEHGIRATAICPSYVNTDMARAITDFDPDRMTDPDTIAQAAELILNFPDTASVAEFNVNCMLEPSF
ncbi:MAG: SDR family NAD(P)-dependent oxidoreductase [Pseudomonadota bacterium]|nr:SDR family NAD(P)-dependent oxidoreductase [Pseudomonadota bacterium]